MLIPRFPKAKARRLHARNAKWCGKQAVNLVALVRDLDRCILLVEIPASGKPGKCVLAQPKHSWQFEGKRSKDDKVLAATGDQLLVTGSATQRNTGNDDHGPERLRFGLIGGVVAY